MSALRGVLEGSWSSKHLGIRKSSRDSLGDSNFPGKEEGLPEMFETWAAPLKSHCGLQDFQRFPGRKWPRL